LLNFNQKKYKQILSKRFNWLVTGAAGFIGSNIVERLLMMNQNVIGLDNFSTGKKQNIEELLSKFPSSYFNFVEGDITNFSDCKASVSGVDYVLHQAALGSVPRSIENPIMTNEANISGFLNMLVASRDAKVKSFIYAASSSTYGDHPDLPKKEDIIGRPLSPYAVTKLVNEIYAEVFSKTYHISTKGLRYFNVFGKRQDPFGPYAAVIPKWISAMINNEDVFINGDGNTSRDFCYVENVIQANIIAALAHTSSASEIYNIAVGNRTSLLQLFALIKQILNENKILYDKDPVFRDFRDGDVRHSHADISKAIKHLGYQPQYPVLEGLREAMPWYIENL
jgi:UDP-N-acetylglucosamine 4-epimerase